MLKTFKTTAAAATATKTPKQKHKQNFPSSFQPGVWLNNQDAAWT